MKTATCIVISIIALVIYTNPDRKEHGICMFQEQNSEIGMLVIEQNTEYHKLYIF